MAGCDMFWGPGLGGCVGVFWAPMRKAQLGMSFAKVEPTRTQVLTCSNRTWVLCGFPTHHGSRLPESQTTLCVKDTLHNQVN